MKFLTALRTELGQLSYSLKARKTRKGLKDQIAAIRHIHISNLPAHQFMGKRHEIWAVSVVKNELDILPHTISHFFRQGIDRILIADNLSTDGTREYVIDLAARDSRIIFAWDNYDVHLQSEKMTYLCHRAWQSGAAWIIPFDGDEFWFAPRGQTLAEFLRASASETAVYYAGFHHTVPVQNAPDDIINTELIMDTANSFPGKVAFRAHPLAGLYGVSKVHLTQTISGFLLDPVWVLVIGIFALHDMQHADARHRAGDPVSGTRMRRLLVYLGEVSFAFYLVHELVIFGAVAAPWGASAVGGVRGLILMGASLALGVFLAIAAHHLVERPARIMVLKASTRTL